MRKLGVGVLGVGEMGRRHAENLRRLVPQARLVAVADVAGDRARQVAAELEIDRSENSLEAMLELKDVDCVVIATPDKFHPRAIVAAAEAGKDILCEKPIALTLADAHAALQAVAAEMRDFVDNMLHDRPPRVSGEEGLHALAIAVAAENSLLQRRPCAVELEAKVAVPEEVK